MQLVSLNRLGLSRPMRSVVKFDFTSGVLPPGVSFSRASTGLSFNSSRVLTQAAIGAARFDYSYADGSALGLRIEQAQTNSLLGSDGNGAVAGTPGTLPADWAFNAMAGITRSVVGVGVQDGIAYTDIRYQGTSGDAGGGNQYMSASTAIAAAPGQTWAISAYLALVAGSLPAGFGITLGMVTRTSGGGAASTGAASANLDGAVITSLTGTMVRYNYIVPLVATDTAFLHPKFVPRWNSGVAVDFTLRVGLPQLVQGTVLGSPIKTSTVAVTRAGDVVTITDPAGLYYPVWVVKARTPIGYGSNRYIMQLDGGTNSHACLLYREAGTGRIRFWVAASGVTQAHLDLGFVADDTDFAVAVRAMDNAFAGSLNGGAIVTDTSGAVPLGMSTLRVGSGTTPELWTSTIKSIELRRMATDAQLQQLAA